MIFEQKYCPEFLIADMLNPNEEGLLLFLLYILGIEDKLSIESTNVAFVSFVLTETAA